MYLYKHCTKTCGENLCHLMAFTAGIICSICYVFFWNAPKKKSFVESFLILRIDHVLFCYKMFHLPMLITPSNFKNYINLWNLLFCFLDIWRLNDVRSPYFHLSDQWSQFHHRIAQSTNTHLSITFHHIHLCFEANLS